MRAHIMWASTDHESGHGAAKRENREYTFCQEKYGGLWEYNQGSDVVLDTFDIVDWKRNLYLKYESGDNVESFSWSIAVKGIGKLNMQDSV